MEPHKFNIDVINRVAPKYILIHDWLPTELLSAWQARLVSELMDPGLVVPPGSLEDSSVPQVKRNLNLWITGPDPMCEQYHRQYWSSTVKQARISMNDLLFTAQDLITEGNFLASRYMVNDYYDWHRDLTPYLSATWIVKSADEGGDFDLALDPQNRTWHRVPARTNTLIIFPSQLTHRVTPVIRGERQSLQYFCSREFPD